MKVLSCLLLLSACLLSVQAHSYMSIPKPMDMFTGGCRVGGPPEFPQNCPGPCENNRDEKTVVATYERGRAYEMRWAKNNHDHGFVRWTIIKKGQTMDKKAHDDFAFLYSCWSATLTSCKDGHECGSDEQGKAWRTTVTIPEIYPDGEYTLGWAWFGGGTYSYLGDYYSCATIRIQGGPMKAEYAPQAEQCLSTMSAVGQCPVEPCTLKRAASVQFPLKFQNGNKPATLKAADFGAVVSPSPVPPPPPPPPPAGIVARLEGNQLKVTFPKENGVMWYFVTTVDGAQRKFVYKDECGANTCEASLPADGVTRGNTKVYVVSYKYSPQVTVA